MKYESDVNCWAFFKVPPLLSTTWPEEDWDTFEYENLTNAPLPRSVGMFWSPSVYLFEEFKVIEYGVSALTVEELKMNVIKWEKFLIKKKLLKI